jgi:hypothetical protein
MWMKLKMYVLTSASYKYWIYIQVCLNDGCHYWNRNFLLFRSIHFSETGVGQSVDSRGVLCEPLPFWPFISTYTINIFRVNNLVQSNLFYDCFFDWLLVLNATFSNIPAMSWRKVLVVEEAEVPGENHRPWASNWEAWLFAAASWVHPGL